jgi:hypothetical protein
VGCAQSAATAWAAAGVDCMVVSRVTPQYAEAHSVRARMTRHITGVGALVGACHTRVQIAVKLCW